jgi:hypothetical protein
MQKLNYESVIFERLKRQGLLTPLENIKNEKAYIELFKSLQPVAPVHFTRPGDPPRLVHRTSYDDSIITGKLRKKHKLVKGRFLGGRIGYVLEEDLKLFATVFKKPLNKAKPIHEDIMEVIKSSGGISKEKLKEEMDYSAGEISKELKPLQEAFILYEQQLDTDWDTGLFDFRTEWFDIDSQQDQYEQAVSKIILHFLSCFVFATMDQAKSWSQLNVRLIKQVLKNLLEENKIIEITIEGLGTGFIRKEDLDSLEYHERPRTVFVLDKSDFLVRSYMRELQEKYKGLEVLQYLLIDGEFQGAVLGHWRIGPYDIDDIKLDIDEKQAQSRREEIIKAVRKIYPSESTVIHKFNGKSDNN